MKVFSLCGSDRAYASCQSRQCCCLLVLEVGAALVEVVLGMPSLGMLFALGIRGGADESLHADLALYGRNLRDEIIHIWYIR